MLVNSGENVDCNWAGVRIVYSESAFINLNMSQGLRYCARLSQPVVVSLYLWHICIRTWLTFLTPTILLECCLLVHA